MDQHNRDGWQSDLDELDLDDAPSPLRQIGFGLMVLSVLISVGTLVGMYLLLQWLKT